jgi:hypothetical protein
MSLLVKKSTQTQNVMLIMTEENNTNVDETTVEETQETNNVEEETVVETEETTTDNDEYAEELARLKKENENKDKKIANLSYKVREQKREEKEETQDTSNFVTKEDLAEHERKILGVQIDTEISKVSGSESETQLIKYHLENSVKSSGNITEDVENAKLFANKQKIFQENAMVKKEAIANQNKTNGFNSSQRKKTKTEPTLGDRDKKTISMGNLKFNPQTGRYEGKKTYYDPKTGVGGSL